MTLSNVQIGSVVYNMFENIPTGVSGLLANGILVDNQVYFAEEFTGATLSTAAISNSYQPAIISLTAANVLRMMESQGLGTKSVKIGELSITKGMVDNSSNSFWQDGMNKLKAIGERHSFYQTFT